LIGVFTPLELVTVTAALAIDAEASAAAPNAV
jgi:hypothetical protein